MKTAILYFLVIISIVSSIYLVNCAPSKNRSTTPRNNRQRPRATKPGNTVTRRQRPGRKTTPAQLSQIDINKLLPLLNFGKNGRGETVVTVANITIDDLFVYKPNSAWRPSSNFDASNIPSWLVNLLSNFLSNATAVSISQISIPIYTPTPRTPQPIMSTNRNYPATPPPAPTPPPLSALSKICGTTGAMASGKAEAYIPSPLDRIVGGTATSPNEMPWQARVMSVTPRGTALCGGTIINARTILTAAHCVSEGGTTLRVIVGDYSIRNYDTGEFTASVAQTIVHPQYSTTLNNNDFAILLLSKDLTFGTAIKPACLPKDNLNDFNNANALVSGWGRLSEMNSNLPDVMQKASTRVTPFETCKQTYARGRITITPQMICAAAPRIDTCQGDSGGPLITVVNGRYTLIGVTSFGIGCAGSFPGVYSRVSSALSWIQSTAGNYGTA